MTDYTSQAIATLARVERGEPLTELDQRIIAPLLHKTVESGRIPFIKKLDGYLIGTVKRPSLRGIEYCRVILMGPGEVTALDVMSAGQREPPSRTDLSPCDTALQMYHDDFRPVGMSASYDELLDERAICQIKARIAALEELDTIAASRELEQIKALFDNDTYRGKARSFVADNERARQAVCQSIRYAIRSLVDDDETHAIGLHLKRYIKTGRLCSYSGKLKWQFS